MEQANGQILQASWQAPGVTLGEGVFNAGDFVSGLKRFVDGELVMLVIILQLLVVRLVVRWWRREAAAENALVNLV